MVITFIFITYHHIVLFNSLMTLMKEIYSSMGINVAVPEIHLNFTTYVIAYIVLVTYTILVSFLWYWITHLCVKIIGGKHNYSQTYKAMTYSLSADYLTLPAFIISIISLTIFVTKESHLSKIIFIVSTALYLIPSFYRLYLRLVALERLQDISKLRAFIAAYVLAYLFLSLATIIICAILIGILWGVFTLVQVF